MNPLNFFFGKLKKSKTTDLLHRSRVYEINSNKDSVIYRHLFKFYHAIS